METLFSTRDVRPRDRFDYWHEVACRNIIKHDSQPECRLKFQATMQKGMLADVELFLFKNSSMDVARTPRQIAQATDNAIFVCQQLSGTLALEQNGREIVLEPGDVTLLDPLQPYVGKFSRASNMLVLKAPRHALEVRVGTISEMVVRSIKPSEAEGSLASSYLAMLPVYTGRMCATAEEIVKDQALDLVALSLAKAMGRPSASSADSRALVNARNAIEAQPTAPALGYQPWSKTDLFFLVDSLQHGRSFHEVAGFLRRDEDEVREKATAFKLIK
jgi:AraC family transcriptional activator of tynA and feaB